jgi:hypothetical protein
MKTKRRILAKAWKAFPVGLKQIRESDRRKEITKRIVDKAREHLAMNGTETLPQEDTDGSSELDESFFQIRG